MVIKAPEISVLIVNYKQKEDILKLVASLRGFLKNISYEVLVFDNSNDFLDSKFSTYSVGENIGYGSAINHLASKANGEYYLILNADVELQNNFENAFKKFVNETDITYGVMSLGKRDKQNSIPFINKFTNTYRFSGFCFLVNCHVFKQLGGFNPNYFMYFEDDDFNLRLKRFGFNTYFPDKIYASHKKTYHNEKNKVRKNYYYKSQLYFLKDNYRLWYFIFFVPNKVLSYITRG